EPEAQTDARPRLDLDAGHAIEALEQVRALRLRNARPTIADRYAYFAWRRGEAQRHRLVDGRVLERVGEQVGEHLADAVGVHIDGDWPLGQIALHEPVRRRDLFLYHLPAQRDQVIRLSAQRQLARLDARDVEQVVDQQLHSHNGPLHARQMHGLRVG